MIDCKGRQDLPVPANQGGVSPDPDRPGLDHTTQRRIGSQLRAFYDDLMQQPIPDRFVDLIAHLDRAGQTPKES